MQSFLYNQINRIVNWYVSPSFQSEVEDIVTNEIAAKLELGDRLPDEVIGIIFTYLSPLNLMSSCELVCRKWKKITHEASLWEDSIFFWQKLASPFDNIFYYQPNQPINLEIKREICARLETNPCSKKEFFNYLKKICYSVEIDKERVLAISYESASDINTFFKFYIIHTDSSSFIKDHMNEVNVFNKNVMKESSYFYSICGQNEADFSLQNEKNTSEIQKNDENLLPEMKILIDTNYIFHYRFLSLQETDIIDIAQFIKEHLDIAAERRQTSKKSV